MLQNNNNNKAINRVAKEIKMIQILVTLKF